VNNLIRKIVKLPKSPGIYQFFDREKLLYVGKSVSLRNRVASYFKTEQVGPKTKLLVKKTTDIKYIKVFSEFEALLLEAELIKKYKPFFNTVAKDDKSPLYIKISNDDIPLVTVTRREKPKKGVFLKGPFPSAKTTREVLKIIRRIFPYCHHQNPKKPCLFVHLGLCPFPYGSDDAQKDYLATITKIKQLLGGKSQYLVRQLTNEMKKLSAQEKYEEAQIIKRQIEKVEYITTSYHAPEEFLKQPTLVDDLTMLRLKDLAQVLELKKIPKRIECYDISSISGNLATGSMIVFENGQSAKGQYRRFRIKFTHRPNDYEMLKEILVRRFKNDWPKPDLVIVDGGRGQLNSALSVIDKYSIECQVIALAKRFEQIYLPQKILPISLSKESPARQLAEAIRDEAHRFAIQYHRLLRSKRLLEN